MSVEGWDYWCHSYVSISGKGLLVPLTEKSIQTDQSKRILISFKCILQTPFLVPMSVCIQIYGLQIREIVSNLIREKKYPLERCQLINLSDLKKQERAKSIAEPGFQMSDTKEYVLGVAIRENFPQHGMSLLSCKVLGQSSSYLTETGVYKGNQIYIFKIRGNIILLKFF